MCGIVGLFAKHKAIENDLGHLMADMLITMTDRGPDSAGFALYGYEEDGWSKLTIQSANPAGDFAGLEKLLADSLQAKVRLEVKSTHGIVHVPAGMAADVRALLETERPGIRVMSVGDTIEIYKEVGLPADVSARFALRGMSGTHAIGHTRMATESAVTTLGAHPFSTGPDQCLVHNGSLSNHNNIRRELKREGMRFETENDTEVAAAYVSNCLAHGMNLGQALESSLDNLDGFYTFVVGSKRGFGVLRDPIACKPAVMAETDDYVAFGSEYRALVNLPGIDAARVWEPEPATVYFWER